MKQENNAKKNKLIKEIIKEFLVLSKLLNSK